MRRSEEKIYVCGSQARKRAAVHPGGGGTWVNVCWVGAAGLLEPLPHYSLCFGQL